MTVIIDKNEFFIERNCNPVDKLCDFPQGVQISFLKKLAVFNASLLILDLMSHRSWLICYLLVEHNTIKKIRVSIVVISLGLLHQ